METSAILPIAITLLVILIVFLITRNSKRKKITVIVYEEPSTFDLSDTEKTFLQALQLRSTAKKPLIVDDRVGDIARQFSKIAYEYNETHGRQIMAHVGSGNRATSVIALGGKNFSEVYAPFFHSGRGAVNGLMMSPLHKIVITGGHTHIGVAVYKKHYTAIYFTI